MLFQSDGPMQRSNAIEIVIVVAINSAHEAELPAQRQELVEVEMSFAIDPVEVARSIF
jgi:hypothetical protein